MYEGNYISVVIHEYKNCGRDLNVTSGKHFYNTVLCAAETCSWFRFAIIKFQYQQITSYLFYTNFFPFTELLCSNILSNSFLETHALLTWQILVSFIMKCQMWYTETYICQWEECSGYAYDSWCQLHVKIKKPSLHAEITI